MILVVTAVLMAGTAGLLLRLQSGQKLGKPGVKTAQIDSKHLKVVLPENVAGYKAEFLETDQTTISTLPADTSFGQARYSADDGFIVLMNVVLMGRDRTSLHKPQFCLAGMGWSIDNAYTLEESVRIEKPEPYDLPVVRLISNRVIEHNGSQVNARGIYVYWFVADDAVSASVSGFERMWWMGLHLFKTGELQRWAYVSCFSVCAPGQEEATYQRMKQLIAESVPQFQKKPGAADVTLATAE
jgi:hypothetical protein